jgi:hypothetical protein
MRKLKFTNQELITVLKQMGDDVGTRRAFAKMVTQTDKPTLSSVLNGLKPSDYFDKYIPYEI